ncbi:MAG: hypothetical protein DMF50_00045 [Acidobacteria bacterium]|nr:MAG: hypothetical protein DMF50_00045 [Acidobacteriota bacterium]
MVLTLLEEQMRIPALAFAGWRAWSQLRRDAEETRGAAFDLRAFHDEALSFGAVPIGALRALLFGPTSSGSGRTPSRR